MGVVCATEPVVDAPGLQEGSQLRRDVLESSVRNQYLWCPKGLTVGAQELDQLVAVSLLVLRGARLSAVPVDDYQVLLPGCSVSRTSALRKGGTNGQFLYMATPCITVKSSLCLRSLDRPRVRIALYDLHHVSPLHATCL